jgi:hypothetical protein
MLDKAVQAGRHKHRDRKSDYYDTPPEAVQALLKTESLPHKLWEPACGKGNIVMALRNAGHWVHATDLNERGCPNSHSRIDFLLEQKPDIGIQAIITNPPFMLANQFAYHAIRICPLVYLLLRLAFMEGVSRSTLLDSGLLKRVHVFKRRIPMMHREGWQGMKSTNSLVFAWFIFERGNTLPATIDRIDW